MSSTNTLGKYQITREIARSNDIVYEAIDPSLGRTVALKELNLPGNLSGAQKRERIERFLREGKAAGQLSHPNIVTVYDVGQDGDRFYIAMEYLGGQTLREVLQMRGALPVKDAVDMTLQLCSALAYAHQHNVVHRDVKPENVQVLAGGHVKLTDFGIARIMSEPSITQDGQVFGTPSYMSPEQVAGKQIDGRSDIFSVGVMLYEMLAGQKPFTGDTVVTITYNIMNSEPAAPPGVPPYLVGIVRKAMAKDPNFRYQSIEDLVNDLKNEPQNGAVFGSDPFAGTFSGPVPTQTGQSTYGPPPTSYGPPPTTYSPAPQHAPDPFAQAPPPMAPLPDPIPREPILSPETRAFFGTLFLVVGLAGLLTVAVWAVMRAYHQFDERTRGQIAAKFVDQGNKLWDKGDYAGAMKQYESARRAAGDSDTGSEARRRVAQAYTHQAGIAMTQRNYANVKMLAGEAVAADPKYSGGHYYKGFVASVEGDPSYDDELRQAIKVGGTDDFAQAARKYLCQIYLRQGDTARVAGRVEQAKELYHKVIDDPLIYDPDYSQQAQDALTGLGG